MEFMKKNKAILAVILAIAVVVGMVLVLENKKPESYTTAIKKKAVSVEQTAEPDVTTIPSASPAITNLPESVAADLPEEDVAEVVQTYSINDEAMAEEVVLESILEDKNTEECTMSINCAMLLDKLDRLDKEQRKLIPADGCILQPVKVEVKDGDSVFDILKRATKDNQIHLEFVNTPIYNSAYIEGIYNIYEFDCGELSGWMYSVNGKFPNYGCSGYKVKPGDVIVWHYTCDLGRDVSGSVVSQKDE